MAGEIPGWVAMFSASAPDPTGARIGTGLLTSTAATVTAVGGSGTYTYAWTYVSGSVIPTISSDTSSAPTWSATQTAPTTLNAVWQCVVTTGQGIPDVTFTVALSMEWAT